MSKNLYKVIMLGAAWGIFEATVGYFLHISGIRIGSMIWFPLAYFFVHKAYSYTSSFSLAMLTPFIAASLKLINLFFPGPLDRVINPAVSIVLEALAVMLVYKYVLNKRLDKVNPLSIALTGFIWRGLYICYIFSMPQEYFNISSFREMDSFLEFMFLKNLINIVIISAGFSLSKILKREFSSHLPKEAINPISFLKPELAAGSMVLAIIAQVFIR